MMEVFILILVVAGALFAIGSGIWVAIALVGNLTKNRDVPAAQRQKISD